jgi:acetyl esterase/lipase
MPLDRRVSRFLDMLAVGGGQPRGPASPQERRQALQNLARMVDDDSEAVIGPQDDVLSGPAGPISIRMYSPLTSSAALSPGLLYFHGGGWVAGGFDTHDGVCRRLANAAACRVIAVDYRLAPEHPFPAALDDACAALEAVARDHLSLGVDPTRLGVAGDSAGAGLAAALCQQIRDRGGPHIAVQALICPILDLAAESASRIDYAEGYFLNRAAMAQDLDDYCPPGVDRADPRLSPLRTPDLSGLPPAVIHTAAYDPFRDEGEAYAAALAASGGTVTSMRHPGMIHYFYAMPRALPYALSASARFGADIQALIGRLEA